MFLGRDNELDSLKSLLNKRTSSLVALRGRRRIGKSTLVEEFAKRYSLRFIELDGLMLARISPIRIFSTTSSKSSPFKPANRFRR